MAFHENLGEFLAVGVDLRLAELLGSLLILSGSDDLGKRFFKVLTDLHGHILMAKHTTPTGHKRGIALFIKRRNVR